MTVKELLENCAVEIISFLPGEFSSRDFIWALMTEHELEYVRLLFDDGSNHPIQNVHQQIGRYLADHAEKSLAIVSMKKRNPGASPFGKESSTMMWRKQ